MKRYMHKKTGGLYRVMDEKARIESEGMDGELQVVYRHAETGSVWVRPSSEFFDGRFELVNE